MQERASIARDRWCLIFIAIARQMPLPPVNVRLLSLPMKTSFALPSTATLAPSSPVTVVSDVLDSIVGALYYYL